MPLSATSNCSISIVIPVYNGEMHLGEALRCALAQDANVTEIIVIDDGSSDGTPAVVGGFADRRIRYARQERGGIGAARNRGVAMANGAMLAFLDSDDVWASDKLRLQCAALEQGEGDMIFCLVDEFASPELEPDAAARLLLRPPGFPAILASALLMRRNDFERVGPFGEQWRMGEFLDWYGRASDLGLRVFTVPQPLLRRRLHASNSGRTNSSDYAQYARVLKAVLDRRRAAP